VLAARISAVPGDPDAILGLLSACFVPFHQPIVERSWIRAATVLGIPRVMLSVGTYPDVSLLFMVYYLGCLVGGCRRAIQIKRSHGDDCVLRCRGARVPTDFLCLYECSLPVCCLLLAARYVGCTRSPGRRLGTVEGMIRPISPADRGTKLDSSGNGAWHTASHVIGWYLS